MRTITLLDGEHVLKPPTFYAMALMDDYRVDFPRGFTPSNTAKVLAALLTDAEPFSDGEPDRVWTAAEAAKVIPPSDAMPVIEALGALLGSAFPNRDSDEGDESPLAG